MWILFSKVSRVVQPVLDAGFTLVRERPIVTGSIVVVVAVMIVMLVAEIADDRATGASIDKASPTRLKR